MTLLSPAECLDQTLQAHMRAPLPAHRARGNALAERFAALGRDTHALLRQALRNVEDAGPDRSAEGWAVADARADAWHELLLLSDALIGEEHADTPGLRAALVRGLASHDANMRRSCASDLFWHCWARKDEVHALGGWQALAGVAEDADADVAWIALNTLECLALVPLPEGGITMDEASYGLFVRLATEREGLQRRMAVRALSRLAEPARVSDPSGARARPVDRAWRARLRADGIVGAARAALEDAELEAHEVRDLRRFLRRMGAMTRR